MFDWLLSLMKDPRKCKTLILNLNIETCRDFGPRVHWHGVKVKIKCKFLTKQLHTFIKAQQPFGHRHF